MLSTLLRGCCIAAAGGVMVLLSAGAPAHANDEVRIGLITGGCVGCHGGEGGGGHGIPNIAKTMTRAEFVATMKAFRENKNNPTVMNRIARGYTDEEFALMAIRWAKPE